MARSRAKRKGRQHRSATRGHARAHPQGQLSVTPAGFGFVRTAEGEFFVPASKMKGAFDGDVVYVAPLSANGRDANAAQAGHRPAARVVSVASRAHEVLVGRYEVADPFGVVVPEDARITHDVFTERAACPEARDGDLVRVRITSWPQKGAPAFGEVVEVLGAGVGPTADIEAVVRVSGLATAFDDAALEQAAAARMDVEGALGAGYRDLRGDFTFTVDPPDARDFDDAVSVQALPEGGMLLGVHIADVSSYVPWGSAVDAAARARATSVYLPDRVIPMLPEALSCDVCSLVPGQDRRAMSVLAHVAPDGTVVKADMFPSVIRSSARLSYDQAQCFIDAARSGSTWREAAIQAARCDRPQGALPLADAACERLFSALPALDAFARARFAARQAKGGMDFNRKEAKVVLDDAGTPQGVRLRVRTDATSCIEEVMICANECVARRLIEADMPAAFRVHEPPSRDALSLLWMQIQELDCERTLRKAPLLAGDPLELQRAVALAAGRPEAQLVSMLVLRAMKRAAYSPANSGHFGLASDAYCHFTSPIRRYPDLIVHRMLKALAHGRGEDWQAQVDALPDLARHSSRMERVAEDAERQTQALKLVEYMRRFVGQTLPGVVSGVSSLGLYVELENTAEGIVPMRDLGDEYFSIDPVRNTLSGSDSGRRFRLGQRVRVVVADAPAHATRLTFRLA